MYVATLLIQQLLQLVNTNFTLQQVLTIIRFSTIQSVLYMTIMCIVISNLIIATSHNGSSVPWLVSATCLAFTFAQVVINDIGGS